MLNPFAIAEEVEALAEYSGDPPCELEGGRAGALATHELRDGSVRDSGFALDVTERESLLLAKCFYSAGEVLAERQVLVVGGVASRIARRCLLARHWLQRGHVTAAPLAARTIRGSRAHFWASNAPLIEGKLMSQIALTVVCVVVAGFAGALFYAVSKNRTGMTASNRVGWVTLIALAAIGLSMFFTAIGRADSLPQSSLVDRLILAQGPLASRKEEAVDARELAVAIDAAAKGDRGWAALLLTTAASESALSARIARGDCLKHECDGGRAWSLYQIHSNEQNSQVWGSTDIQVQTNEALRMLKQAGNRCQKIRDVPRATCIVRAYAGRDPRLSIKREEQRLAIFNRVLRRL